MSAHPERISMLVIAIAVAMGCTDTSRAPEPASLGDAAMYASAVEPYVGLGCGSLDCHGDPGLQLRLHGRYGLRADASLRDQPTTAGEVQLSVLSFAAIDPGVTGERHLALLKGLDVDAGGVAHVGGPIWTSTASPGYLCLSAWLAGRSSEATAQDACDDAFAELDVD